MENRSSYSKDPDYLTHGFEYQQHSAPSARYHSAEQHDTAPRSTSLCNGTANRIQPDIKEFPQNNNLLEESQHDRKGTFFLKNPMIQQMDRSKHVCLTAALFFFFFYPSSASRAGRTAAFSPPQEDSFHKPVKLAGVTSDCEPELRQTLLSNGHTLRASQSESAPLRRASD